MQLFILSRLLLPFCPKAWCVVLSSRGRHRVIELIGWSTVNFSCITLFSSWQYFIALFNPLMGFSLNLSVLLHYGYPLHRATKPLITRLNYYSWISFSFFFSALLGPLTEHLQLNVFCPCLLYMDILQYHPHKMYCFER